MKNLLKSPKRKREERIRDFLLNNKRDSAEETYKFLNGKSIQLFKAPTKIWYDGIIEEFSSISFSYHSIGNALYVHLGNFSLCSKALLEIDVMTVSQMKTEFKHGILFRNKGYWFFKKSNERDTVLSSLKQIKGLLT